MSYWGIAKVIEFLRAVFLHQILPDDPDPAHITWWARQAYPPNYFNANGSVRGIENAAPVFLPTDVQFLGPGMRPLPYTANRITISFGKDRRITDVSVG